MLFIVTGGTIDKEPRYLPDGSFDNDSKIFGDTHLPEMLNKAHYLGERSIETLFMFDSLDMTDENRAKISKAIGASDDAQVIVTYGTDTMPETGRFLARDA